MSQIKIPLTFCSSRHSETPQAQRGSVYARRGSAKYCATRRSILIILAVILGACSQETPSPISTQGPFYEVHCKEPLPVFTLGENSNPTKDQETALCACIWKNLGKWEGETSEKIAQGKESEISWLNMHAFPARFGSALEKCGGMKL